MTDIQVGDIVRIKKELNAGPFKVIIFLDGCFGLVYADNYLFSRWRKADELVLISRPKSIESGSESTNS